MKVDFQRQIDEEKRIAEMTRKVDEERVKAERLAEEQKAKDAIEAQAKADAEKDRAEARRLADAARHAEQERMAQKEEEEKAEARRFVKAQELAREAMEKAQAKLDAEKRRVEAEDAAKRRIASERESSAWKIAFLCIGLIAIFVMAIIGGTRPSQRRPTNGRATQNKEKSAEEAPRARSQRNARQYTAQGNVGGQATGERDSRDRTPPASGDNMRTEADFAKILELTGKTTPGDIRDAYRKVMKDYHPDRVAHLGSELRRVAEQKSKEINEAYAYFRKRYNF